MAIVSAIGLAALVLRSTAWAESPPRLSAKQALELAEQTLSAKSAGGVYVSSIVLQQTSLLNGKRVWTVQWSESVDGSKPGNKEVGLEIGMDGSVTHLIKGRGTTKPQALPH